MRIQYTAGFSVYPGKWKEEPKAMPLISRECIFPDHGLTLENAAPSCLATLSVCRTFSKSLEPVTVSGIEAVLGMPGTYDVGNGKYGRKRHLLPSIPNDRMDSYTANNSNFADHPIGEIRVLYL